MTEEQEMKWASQFTCDVHGNMGATAVLAAAVTTKKTCLICEGERGENWKGVLTRGAREVVTEETPLRVCTVCKKNEVPHWIYAPVCEECGNV